MEDGGSVGFFLKAELIEDESAEDETESSKWHDDATLPKTFSCRERRKKKEWGVRRSSLECQCVP